MSLFVSELLLLSAAPASSAAVVAVHVTPASSATVTAARVAGSLSVIPFIARAPSIAALVTSVAIRKTHLNSVDVVGAMLQIAEAESLEEGTRHLVIEFVITLTEARERAPGMMRKLSQFISRMFAILMKMLLDIEDDPAWPSAKTEDEDVGETSNYSVGQECLDRLSISLGGNTIIPIASEQLPAYLAAPEWQKRHAALIALAQIAEGCSKVMIKNLDQVVAMVLNSFNDQHPRAHAASAVLNFNENCTPDILTPYLDGIVSKLLVILQNGKQMLQKGVLTALASVADSSQTITLGDKRIGIKTSVLEEKATTCNMLCCYADELKEGFFPWIDQVAETLVPLLKFYFHEEVRKAAVSSIPELLSSSKLAIEKGQSQGRDASYLKFLSDSIIPALVDALHKVFRIQVYLFLDASIWNSLDFYSMTSALGRPSNKPYASKGRSYGDCCYEASYGHLVNLSQADSNGCLPFRLSAFLLSSSNPSYSFPWQACVGFHRCQWLPPILSMKTSPMLCHSMGNQMSVLGQAGIESIDSFASVTNAPPARSLKHVTVIQSLNPTQNTIDKV
ncbi:Importin [Arachis hypogaea]|nr:Importin [Arachis hypogaea]